MLLRPAISLLLISGALLACVADAGAHGGGRQQGYVSSFSSLDPPVLGVLVNVFGPRNRIQVTNYSGKPVVILGYDLEPYLRLTGRAVYENVASPTAYLNSSRPLPAKVSAGEPPQWRKIARGAAFSWHDHRTVWTGAHEPTVVVRAPREPHLIFRWRIPATVGRKPFAIKGFLGWAPRPQTGGDNGWVLPVAAGAGAAALVAAAAVTLGLRARRTRRQAL
jgi:hypothetical protein